MEYVLPTRKMIWNSDTPRPRFDATLLVIAALLTVAASGNNVLPGDVAVTKWIQAVQVPGSSYLVQFTNWAGTGVPIAVLMVGLALGFGLFARVDLAVLVAMTIVARSLNPLLKVVTGSPRPADDLIQVAQYAPGQGFPSGHVMSTTLFYGVIFFIAQTRVNSRPVRCVICVLAMVMILTTGFARVQVGAHWPSDVLGGYLWSTIILVGVIRLHQYIYGSGKAWSLFGFRERAQEARPAPVTRPVRAYTQFDRR
jgi:undecaprenyl-diphosphatase